MRSYSRRFVVLSLFAVSLSAPVLAAELTVKVIDPSAAAVSGAQVEVFTENSSRPAALGVTSGQGTTHFNHLPDAGLRVRVLAAGFAESWQSLSSSSNAEEQAADVPIALPLAVASETVVV